MFDPLLKFETLILNFYNFKHEVAIWTLRLSGQRLTLKP